MLIQGCKLLFTDFAVVLPEVIKGNRYKVLFRDSEPQELTLTELMENFVCAKLGLREDLANNTEQEILRANNLSRCKTTNKIKPIEEFYVRTKSNGSLSVDAHCKKCKRKKDGSEC